MKKNMAILERVIRVIAGITLVVLYFTKDISTPWNYVMLGAGIVFTLTGLAGNCPLYSLFRIDTRQFK